MKNRATIEKLRLKVNIFVFLFFFFIIILHAFKIEGQVIKIIGQLLIIPSLIALLAIPIWSLIDSVRKKNINYNLYIITQLVSLLTFGILLLGKSYIGID